MGGSGKSKAERQRVGLSLKRELGRRGRGRAVGRGKETEKGAACTGMGMVGGESAGGSA